MLDLLLPENRYTANTLVPANGILNYIFLKQIMATSNLLIYALYTSPLTISTNSPVSDSDWNPHCIITRL